MDNYRISKMQNVLTEMDLQQVIGGRKKTTFQKLGAAFSEWARGFKDGMKKGFGQVMKNLNSINAYMEVKDEKLGLCLGGKKKKRILTPYNLGRFAGTVDKYGLKILSLLR